MRVMVRVGWIWAVWMASALAPIARAEAPAGVFLSNEQGERYQIGELYLGAGAGERSFRFELKKENFGDYFLSMRPFRCLEREGRMLCYLPYPYSKPQTVSDEEMRPLEYDVLFIQRQKKDYGIDPWNGVYYKLRWEAGQLVGRAHAVDLNVLASPPDEGVVYPLDADDLHPLESEQLWLPKLEVEGAEAS